MDLSQQTKENIQKAHIVRGLSPADYKIKFRNIFELLEYRSKLQPEDKFITYFDENVPKIELTYSEFVGKVFQTANFLKRKGIGVEDRISTVSHNHLNTVIQYFAAWSLGATVVPINVNEDPERIRYILENSRTKLAFVKQEYYDLIKHATEGIQLEIVLHGVIDPQIISGEAIFEDEIKKESIEFKADESVNQETESLIVYTSGTTGLPKGVVLTQYNLMVDAEGISKWHKIDRGQVMMCVLPIHHVNGTVVTLMTPMFAGGSVVLNQKFHTDKFFSRLAEENVHVVSVVPTLLQFLCHEYMNSTVPEELAGLKNFRHIICGAGPLTCELALKFEEMFGLKIVHGYGLSETTCYSCFLPIDIPKEEHTMWLKDFGFPSIGVEIEPNEMDIQNEQGQSVPEMSRGEIVIRGQNVMKYYDENPEANDNTFEFGWFRSGDEGFYKSDANGRKYFFITGRIKELIIRGGVNIAPLEIDEVLMAIPEVKAGIAVGFDNDWYGEEVGALILLREGFSADENLQNKIVSDCRQKLPFHKSPKVVVFCDAIPVTSTGKYQRNKVKPLFEEFKSVQFKP